MDLDLELLRQQRAGTQRADDLDDPGRRSNTDRMRPGNGAPGGGDGLYANKSPLAAVAAPAGAAAAGGDSETPEPMPARNDVFDAPGAPKPPRPDEAAIVDEKALRKGKQPAGGKDAAAAAPGAVPTDAAAAPGAAAKADDPTDANPAAKPAAAAATAAPNAAADKQGGRGGRGAAGSGGSRRGAAAAPPEVTFEVARTAPSDPNPQRTTLGVGEEVNFTSRNPGNWRATTSTGTPSATNTSTFRWKALDTATNPTVTFSRDGQPDIDTNFRLVAPTNIEFLKIQDDPQVPAGVGMMTNLTFGPQTVNFYNVEWLEVPGGPSNVTGYFKQYIDAGRGTLMHEPNPEWTSVDGATNNGVDDHAFMAGKPRLGDPPQWTEGGMDWVIPNVYRVAGTAGRHEIMDVTQRFEIQGGTNAGSMTVTKGGQSATQLISGQIIDSRPELLERFATTTEASNWLTSFGDSVRAVKQGLAKLSNFRAHDRTSYDSMVAALRAFTPAPVLYTSVTCTNTYSWFTQDSVDLTVTGNSGIHNETFDLNTGRHKIIRIPWLSLINPATFNSNMMMSYTIIAEGHTFEMSQPFPFNELGTAQTCPGSENRYTLLSYLRA